MEPIVRTEIDTVRDDGCLSVLKCKITFYNGKEIELERHRETLFPGQFDRAKEILPENLYNALLALWTPNVVVAWEENQKDVHIVE